jgi:hypothetical protein
MPTSQSNNEASAGHHANRSLVPLPAGGAYGVATSRITIAPTPALISTSTRLSAVP